MDVPKPHQRQRAGFYAGVVIDVTTLPTTNTTTHYNVGDRFTVRGHGFNSWPKQVVLSYGQAYLDSEKLPSQRLMRLVEKTPDELVFEITVAVTFATEHTWAYFGTPNDLPRTYLSYRIG